MKDTIVKNAVDNFVKRYDINSDKIKEICETFLWKSIRAFREEDPFLYEDIYNRSSIQQTHLLEERLELDLIGLDEIVDLYTTKLIESFNKAVSLNGSLNDDDFLEENVQTIFEDTITLFYEDKSIMEKVKTFGKEKIITFFQQILKKLPSISAAGALSAPLVGVGVPVSITALLIIILFTTLIYGPIASKMFGVNITKEQLSILSACSDVLVTASKKVKNASEGVKYRYLITFKNEDKCYQKAGLDTKKLNLIDFASIQEDSLWRQLLFFSSEEKLDKMRNCFLENYLDRISIFFELYFDCLRKSGRWNEVQALNDDKIIAMFRMKGGMYPMCDEYRNNAVKAIRNFEDLIDFIFEKTPEKKSKWLLLLNRYILDSKESKDELLRKHQQSNQKKVGFQTDKYKKMGKDLENSDY